jgi:hypothetical protein
MPIRRIGSALLGLSLMGCYTLQPISSGALQAGSKVAFDMNDTGRVALGGSMGPGIDQIEGQLVEAQNGGDYLVAVSSVRLLRGGQQVWRGERVRIRPEFVSSMYERRLSKGRTTALIAAGVGVVAVFVGQSLLGGGGSSERIPTDTAQTLRVPWP